MKIIRKLRYNLFQNQLKKELLHRNTLRRSMGLGEAKSIGILFCADDLKERQIALRMAAEWKSKGKKVQVLGYFDRKLKKEESFEFPHFSKSEVNFAYIPTGQTVQDFSERKFDILFSLTQLSFLPLEYLSAISKANFRVGPPTVHTVCYDLMVDTKQKGDLEHFVRQVEYFLNKLTPVHEPVTA